MRETIRSRGRLANEPKRSRLLRGARRQARELSAKFRGNTHRCFGDAGASAAPQASLASAIIEG
jgi:hypothetical protein